MPRTSIDRDMRGLIERYVDSGAEGRPRPTLLNHASYLRMLAAWLEHNGLGLEDVDAEMARLHIRTTHGQRPAITAIRCFYRWLEHEGFLPDADARLGPKGARLRLGGFPSEVDEALIEEFVLHRQRSGKQIRPHCEAARSFFGYLDGRGIRICDATEDCFLGWCERIRETSSERTAESLITSARVFCRWLEAEGHCGKLVFDEGSRNVRKRTKTTPLRPDEARKVLSAAQDLGSTEEARLRNAALVSMVLLGAIQPVELHRANVGDVSFMDGHAVMLVRGCGGRSDTIAYLPASAARPLRSYLLSRNPEASDPLFVTLFKTKQKTRLRKKDIYKLVSKAFNMAGVEGSSASHRLKQTAVDLAERSGASGSRLAEFARVRHPHSRLENEVEVSDEAIQERISEMLRLCDEGSVHCVISTVQLRAMLEGIETECVDVSVGADGRLSLKEIEIPGRYAARDSK